MRILIGLIPILFSCLNLKSQDSLNRVKLGLDFSVGNNALGRDLLLPSVTIGNNKHTIYLGLIYNVGAKENQYPLNNSYPSAYALQAGYLFYPNGSKNRFNLFFVYDFNYLNASFKFTYPAGTSTQIKNKTIKLTSIENYLGFGFKFNICKWLFLKTTVGLGVIYYGEKINQTSFSGSKTSYEYKSQFFAGNVYPYFDWHQSSSYNSHYDNQKHFID